jgi:cytoskeletal protein CcmA (bactofilin family)
MEDAPMFKSRRPKPHDVSGASFSMLDAETKVRGDVGTEGTLRVAGRLDGNVTGAALLIVASGATIVGQVNAREVIIGGRIEGHVVAQGRVELEATGVVIGDVTADAILVHEGAALNGRMLVRTAHERAAAESTPRSQPLVGRATPRASHLAIAARDA